MKNMKGFTLMEVLVGLVIVSMLLVGSCSAVLNNRGWTEDRAYGGATSFLNSNDIEFKRMTCAGDSDGDGYGTCNVVSSADEKIILNCPTNFFDVNLFGASSCKEVFQNYNLSIGQQ